MKNTFMNFVSEAMLHTNTTAEGKEFVNKEYHKPPNPLF
jgi:hypothetical protein